MSHQRAKQLSSVRIRPVERDTLPDRQDRQRTEEPPEEAIAEPPAQARPIPTYVALEQKAECGADDDGKHKMQSDTDAVRSRVHQSSNERKEIDLCHPLAEGPAANNPRDPTDNQRTWQTKRSHPCPGF